MKAMLLRQQGQPLEAAELPDPTPGPGEVLIEVAACGVCRTDLHVVDGDLHHPRLPLVPGHEIVGHVKALGEGVDTFQVGQRVGVGWLGHTCGHCEYCLEGRENLCDAPGFTGYTRNGGFAELTVAEARYTYPMPEGGDDAEMAPLLCAGLIGWRSLVISGEGKRLGFYGFGAAAHLIAQVARWQGRQVHAFTRPGDAAAQAFALSLGATSAGPSDVPSPQPLDAAIIFAPVGDLVPTALQSVRKGGRVVCAGIYMSDIPSFPYSLLWEERQLVSVANLTRKDAHDFLALVPEVGLRAKVTRYPLAQANQALADLREGRLTGAAVLVP
ncbi:zinc-dependent alcohol dehydrogenase family protein [Stenotrophomonas sp. MMGLT7]|uniref:zinc-dependent alcohol dehydrogenase family protein n=1 Tax=Stenotrophomonas sp. MMGLT7 TaxID=2901227 RepID=UPI001E59E82A|nr:zinc-dependent alcohol dehydrogenase family protein [Stenotrophomonas sp. MMGLT7]MCD7098292.1 zinc-dependent alcohol dehydrogenase family protein [Stenotrophomonas sp. MMGLT7]